MIFRVNHRLGTTETVYLVEASNDYEAKRVLLRDLYGEGALRTPRPVGLSIGAVPYAVDYTTGARAERPVHGAFDDREEQTSRRIARDVRTYGWSYTAGVSW